MHFYNLSVEESLHKLKVRKSGLTDKEADERLKEFGKNKLPEKKRTTAVILFFKQFNNFLIYILLLAAVVSFLLEDIIDALIILAAVLLNVIIGFIQEYKAEKSLAALKKVITPQALVVRNGEEELIKAEDIVPGDILVLEVGSKIAADARLILAEDLEINEAALTGESQPIKKQIEKITEEVILADQKNMVFAGTIVNAGRGRGIVVTTGRKTEIGKIASLVKTTEETTTPLQIKLRQFSRSLGYLILFLSFILFIFGLLRGINFVEIFTTSVAVAVSAIPEGLVVAVTVILAVGMQRVLKRKALVRKLLAAETLGSTNVICADKTGTLTEGKMQVVNFITYDYDFDVMAHKVEPKKLFLKESEELFFALRLGMLCNDAYLTDHGQGMILGNLTERALMQAGMELGLKKEILNRETPRLDTIPFDSAGKFMATLHRFSSDENILYVKGAPEKILGMSNFVKSGGRHLRLEEEERRKFQYRFAELSRQGLRILGLAYQKLPSKETDIKKICSPCRGLVFLGFVGISDPLRQEAKGTVSLCREAGIRTVMITGDHRLTAQTIAQQLSLPAEEKNIIEGEELERISETELEKRVEQIDIYARVSPQDKLRIVKAWQARGKVVAMTGDGINDSPALQAADIGVALGSGTDVAKETADVVLLDNNFKTIVAAVEEGRVIFDNIRKVITYLLADSFAAVILITPAIFFGLPLPILAAQILWVNLVTDGLPSLAMTQEPKEIEIMAEKPRPKSEAILNREMKIIIAIVSLVIGLGSLFLFWYFWKFSNNLELARTIAFTSLAINSLIYVFSTRSLRHSIFKRDVFSNKYLIVAVILSFILQIFAIYSPFLQKVFRTVVLGWQEWLTILLFSLFLITIIEVIKYYFNKRKSMV